MRRPILWCYWGLLCLPLLAAGAEKYFDFGAAREGALPEGFRSLSAGGPPGEWKTLLDDAPSQMPSLDPGTPSLTKRAVVAQVSRDKTDERFCLLVYEPESYGDFSFTTSFKTVAGSVEQMAGVVFRVQNASNYYVVRASSLGNNVRFYKVVNGERGDIIGPQVRVASNAWHELRVECKGNRIRAFLNGQPVIPELIDNSFQNGRIGFWTKSDSVSYFAGAKIVYTPRELPVEGVVRKVLEQYPRLLNLEVFAKAGGTNATRLVAAKDEKEKGRAGGKVEADVIASGDIYYGKEKNSVSVVMPLRDRNGDPVAAVRVVMKTFSGQTEQNAIVRATPVVKEIQKGVRSLEDLINPGP